MAAVGTMIASCNVSTSSFALPISNRGSPGRSRPGLDRLSPFLRTGEQAPPGCPTFGERPNPGNLTSDSESNRPGRFQAAHGLFPIALLAGPERPGKAGDQFGPGNPLS